MTVLVRGDPIFSSYGKRFMYGAKSEKEWFMVVDGEKFKSYEGIGSLSFSPDGKHVVYFGIPMRWIGYMIVDGIEAQQYRGITAILGNRVYFDAPTKFIFF